MKALPVLTEREEEGEEEELEEKGEELQVCCPPAGPTLQSSSGLSLSPSLSGPCVCPAEPDAETPRRRRTSGRFGRWFRIQQNSMEQREVCAAPPEPSSAEADHHALRVWTRVCL